ncbi:MaoC family dehydratase N-terminal domain-containing protein [Sphingomonas oligophenolica]|uniref:MaoC family dehydratase N-terminal domain-containing protein n=1 Tax=Sphingomonas oligophenolica TaxID=301154 RepID=A0ABU9Y6A7_9SPHN
MIDREKFIGYETPAITVDVEKGQLVAFAKATGNDDPIYSDEEAARAAGHPTIPAPPTFAFVLNSLARAKAGPAGNYMAVLGVKVGGFLHGEQAFEYHKTIYAGDGITMKTKVVDIYDKKNGAMEFVVTTVDAVNQHGELCVRQRCNLVVRN